MGGFAGCGWIAGAGSGVRSGATCVIGVALVVGVAFVAVVLVAVVGVVAARAGRRVVSVTRFLLLLRALHAVGSAETEVWASCRPLVFCAAFFVIEVAERPLLHLQRRRRHAFEAASLRVLGALAHTRGGVGPGLAVFGGDGEGAGPEVEGHRHAACVARSISVRLLALALGCLATPAGSVAAAAAAAAVFAVARLPARASAASARAPAAKIFGVAGEAESALQLNQVARPALSCRRRGRALVVRGERVLGCDGRVAYATKMCEGVDHVCAPFRS